MLIKNNNQDFLHLICKLYRHVCVRLRELMINEESQVDKNLNDCKTRKKLNKMSDSLPVIGQLSPSAMLTYCSSNLKGV